MKNKLVDLNNHLFEELERLNDESLKGEALQEERERAKSMANIAQTIINNGELALKAVKHYDEYGNKVLTKEELLSAQVSDLTRPISSDINTDIGSLKSTLLARGDHRATAQEIKDINPDGEYEEGWYDVHVSQSLIMNVQAEFDQLINIVVTKINEILREAAEMESATYPNSTYLRDENGNPLQLFQQIVSEGKSCKLPDGSIWECGWTVSNIDINIELRQNPTLLGFRLTDGSEDNALTERLKKAFEEASYTLNPNVQTPVCFVDYYKNLVSQVANTGYVFGEIMDSQTVTVDSLFNAREQVVGVSSDEELTNMIMFQNAYNASSRYINVISEMLEHVLTTLGR